MSDTVSIPKRLYKDKRLKDFDIRLYLTIIENVNEFGYSKITNETLSHKTCKQERAVQRALKNLAKCEYIQLKFNVKKNDIYDDSVSRVIWRIEKYREHHWKKSREKKDAPKTKENDFKLFLAFLRTDCKKIAFPIDMGGIVQIYRIHEDNMLWLHPKGENPIMLDTYDSMDCYKKMFSKRKAIFAHVTGMQESLSMQELSKSANEKGDD